MGKIWNFLGGRKFLVLILATIGLLVGKLTSADWVIVSGIYTAGNIAEKLLPGQKGKRAE